MPWRYRSRLWQEKEKSCYVAKLSCNPHIQFLTYDMRILLTKIFSLIVVLSIEEHNRITMANDSLSMNEFKNPPKKLIGWSIF